MDAIHKKRVSRFRESMGFGTMLLGLGMLLLPMRSATAAPMDQTTTEKLQAIKAQQFEKHDYVAAEASLLGALAECEDGCDRAVKAQIWLDVGIARVARRGPPSSTLDAFRRALALNPAVRPDSADSDSRVSDYFSLAHERFMSDTLARTVAVPDPPVAPRDASATEKRKLAMDGHYKGRKFVEAEALLLGILKACEDQCRPGLKAGLWSDIAIVRLARIKAQKPVTEAFENALALDPKSVPDETYVTDRGMDIFWHAREKLQKEKAKADSSAKTPTTSAASSVNVTSTQKCFPPCRAGYSCVTDKCVAISPPAAAPQYGECIPNCRSGYACLSGKCVSSCNPPCEAGSICKPGGQCGPNIETP
jgi:hypothetical protein